MKEYLVWLDDVHYIVLAKNAKDAINQVWDKWYGWRNEELRQENKEYGYPVNHIYAKSELSAKSIDRLHKEDGNVIRIW